jgi:hypothetical protein
MLVLVKLSIIGCAKDEALAVGNVLELSLQLRIRLNLDDDADSVSPIAPEDSSEQIPFVGLVALLASLLVSTDSFDSESSSSSSNVSSMYGVRFFKNSPNSK